MNWTISIIADLLGGRLQFATMPPLAGADEPIGKLVTDLGQLGPGDVLLMSDELRAQDPCCELQAAGRGALGVIGTQLHCEPWPGGFFLKIDDYAWSLWQLAGAARADYEGQLIAVAGSVGKSTTAAMIASVLGQPSPSHVVDEEVSLPQQLLQIDSDDPYAIVELHADSNAELDAALHLARPHIAVLIDPHDVDESGRPDDLWQDLPAALLDDGCFIHGPGLNFFASDASCCSQHSYGRDARCDVSPTHTLCSAGEMNFVIDGQLAKLNIWGRHLLDNALAAWSVGRALNIDDAIIAARLARACTPPRRAQVIDAGDVTLIDDTASKSRVSLKATLTLVSSLEANRRVVVCGCEFTDAISPTEFVSQIVEVGSADHIVVVGDSPDEVIQGAIDAGMPRAHCHHCDAGSHPYEILSFLAAGDVILFTGVDADLAHRVLALFHNAAPVSARPAAA